MKLVDCIALVALTLCGCSGCQQGDHQETNTQDSSAKFYYSNGQLKDDFNYRNGRKTGWHTHYRKDGVIEYKVAYKDDVRHGPGYWYDQSGKLQIEEHWNQGQKFGHFKWYFPDGRIKALDFYDFYGKAFCKADYEHSIPQLQWLVVSPGTWSSPRLDTLRVGSQATVQIAFAEVPEMKTTVRLYWDDSLIQPTSRDSLIITAAIAPLAQGAHTLRVEGTIQDNDGAVRLQNQFAKAVTVIP